MFKLWSETNTDIKAQLKPDLGIRSWNDLLKEEKYKIWKFIEPYFFNKEKTVSYYPKDGNGYHFEGEYWYQEVLRKRIILSVEFLNEKNKYKCFADTYLQDKTLLNACNDFYKIFHTQDENIVIEMLSFYSLGLIEFGKERNQWLERKESEMDDEYVIRFNNHQFQHFDRFSNRLNNIFNDFGINLVLTRQGFVPKQDERIIEEIYKPTLNFLSDKKWELVNRELSDAFGDYHNKDYSGTVTKTISAIQAFLQLNVRGEIGLGDISKLIPEAKNKGLIPDDIFTETIFKNIESIFSRERKETADAHPKKEYATEPNARLILNLAMVFMQHFIQFK